MNYANNFLAETIGQLDNQVLRTQCHSVAPSLNLHQDIDKYASSSSDKLGHILAMFKNSVHFSYPLPCIAPGPITRQAINGLDTCQSLPLEKELFDIIKQHLQQRCEKTFNVLEIKNKPSDDEANEGDVISHNAYKYLLELSNHLESNPDPNFDAQYNWYYTGGNIETTVINGQRYLIRPVEKRNHNLALSKLSGRKYNADEILNFTNHTISTSSRDDIFQIDAHNNVILVRQKNCCTLFNIENIEETEISTTNSHAKSDGQHPFISCGLNKTANYKFCSLSLDREITLWTLREGGEFTTEVLHCEGINTNDTWGQVYYVDPNTIAFLDRHSVYFLDLRAHKYGLGTMKFEIKSSVESCDEIFCGTVGHIGLNYIATGHYLLGLDRRKGWTQRWAHGISPSPCLISTDYRDSKEMVLIGCQKSDTVVYVENHQFDGSCFSPVQPFCIPSMAESLNKMRCENVCLDFHLDERFNSSLTGLCCYEDDGLNVLRLTSTGKDVFRQKEFDLSTKIKDEFSESELALLSLWESECKKLFHNLPPVTMNATPQTTKEICKDGEECDSSVQFDSQLESSKMPNSWRKSKAKLLKYRDLISCSILDVWGIEDEEEWCPNENEDEEEEDEEDASSDEELDAAQKISWWFQTHDQIEMEPEG